MWHAPQAPAMVPIPIKNLVRTGWLSLSTLLGNPNQATPHRLV